jgi:hypothetical protein
MSGSRRNIAGVPVEGSMGASVRTIVFGGPIALVTAGFAQAQTPQRPPIGGFGSPPDAMIFYIFYVAH